MENVLDHNGLPFKVCLHSDCCQEQLHETIALHKKLLEAEKVDRSCPVHEDLRNLCSELDKRLADAEKREAQLKRDLTNAIANSQIEGIRWSAEHAERMGEDAESEDLINFALDLDAEIKIRKGAARK